MSTHPLASVYAAGPRPRTGCSLAERDSSAQARWLKTLGVFHAQGERKQHKLFPSPLKPPTDGPQVARVLVKKVRTERMRQWGNCWLDLERWKHLQLDRVWAEVLDHDQAETPGRE